MELTPHQRESARYKFESYCKSIIRNHYFNAIKKSMRKANSEKSLLELSEAETESLRVYDDYPSDKFHFTTNGFDVAIESEKLYDALSELPLHLRDILLLYYFIGFNDLEIAQILKQPRSTVQNRRTRSKAKLKKILGGTENE